MFSGYKLQPPTFRFAKGYSRTSSDVFSRKPLDLLQTPYSKRRNWNHLKVSIMSEIPMTEKVERTYNDLFIGGREVQGMKSLFDLEVSSFRDAQKIEMVNSGLDLKMAEEELSKENPAIVLGMMRPKSLVRNRLISIADYRGIPSQGLTEKIVSLSQEVEERTKRNYHNYLRNLMVEIYAKCGGVPWSLSKPLDSQLFVGIAWEDTPDFYIFAVTTFDRYGLPKYEFFRSYFFERARKFSECNARIIRELFEMIHKDSQEITLHYHGALMSVEKTFLEVSKAYNISCKVLSVERPTDPHFRFYNLQIDNNLAEKGVIVMLDEKRALLSTTGFPHFNISGTPEALFLENLGSIDEKNMLNDAANVYFLSQMNWAHVRGYHKLPVTTLIASNIVRKLRAIYSIRLRNNMPMDFQKLFNWKCFW